MHTSLPFGKASAVEPLLYGVRRLDVGIDEEEIVHPFYQKPNRLSIPPARSAPWSIDRRAA
jgi:hypothetical protein